jgi:hypothetical protein
MGFVRQFKKLGWNNPSKYIFSKSIKFESSGGMDLHMWVEEETDQFWHRPEHEGYVGVLYIDMKISIRTIHAHATPDLAFKALMNTPIAATTVGDLIGFKLKEPRKHQPVYWR